jgi:hypothetical protein
MVLIFNNSLVLQIYLNAMNMDICQYLISLFLFIFIFIFIFIYLFIFIIINLKILS